MWKVCFVFLAIISTTWEDQSLGLKFGPILIGAAPFEPSDYEKSFNATENYITQPLDHLNDSDLRTLQQRYWSMSDFYERKSSDVVFLFINGESAANEKWITNPNASYIQLAKYHNAQVFMLEHRFYGNSIPEEGNQSIENLKYLSSKQALGDIKNFIEKMNINFSNPKWITFGGSYGGALSAWFREKYQTHSVGAIASSAPLNFKINFFEYLQVVQRTLKQFNLDCSQNIGTAFANIQKQLYLSSDSRNKLNEIFNFTKAFSGESSDPKDFQTFFASLIAAFKTAIQNDGYNNVEVYEEGEYGVKNVCEIMKNNDDDSSSSSELQFIQNVQNVFVYMNQDEDAKVNNDYQSYKDSLKEESFFNSNAAIRSWLWQMCTEFGSFQSTDLGRNIFGSAITLDYYIDLCTDVFEFDRSTIDSNIAETKEYYGDLKHFNATNLVLINGSNDPWHALSLYFPHKKIYESEDVVSILINGTAHCADMYPPQTNDLQGLQDAREIVAKSIKEWI